MDLKSIEISRSLLELIRDLPEDEVERVVDTLRLQVAESGDGAAASLAADDGRVFRIALNREDGSTAVVALKFDPD